MRIIGGATIAAVALAAVGAEGGAQRVRIAKLAWDHARIRAWRRWGQEGSPAKAIGDFKSALKEFGIDAYRETTSQKTLEDYLNGQIDKAADRYPAKSERQQTLTAMAGKDGHGKVRYS